MSSTIKVPPSPQHCCTRCVRLSFQKLSPFAGFLGIVFPNLNYTPCLGMGFWSWQPAAASQVGQDAIKGMELSACPWWPLALRFIAAHGLESLVGTWPFQSRGCAPRSAEVGCNNQGRSTGTGDQE